MPNKGARFTKARQPRVETLQPFKEKMSLAKGKVRVASDSYRDRTSNSEKNVNL